MANGACFYTKMYLTEIYNRFIQYPLISTDTRKELRNSLFFCLSGENFNGNQFAKQALENGAAYVVLDDKNYYIEDSRYILVENCLETLQSLAKHHRSHFNIPLIGITGSNGKTTTKELISEVLKKNYSIVSTEGNLNNHIGVPLTLLRINYQTDIAVVEMGANHADEIEFLCKIALPNYGIITNIGKAHLEGFGSLEVIKRTKLALYRAVKKQKGIVFVNFEDSLLRTEAVNLNTISYGFQKEFNVAGQILSEFPFLEMNWGIKNNKEKFNIKSQIFGAFNFPNLMAAIAVGNYFGISGPTISKAIESYTPKNNRSQFVKGNTNELIMDAYNANPSSMNIAIQNFLKDKHPKKMVILGDMFELGDFALIEHELILKSLVNTDLIKVILIGPLFHTFNKIYPNFYFYQSAQELINSLNSHIFKDMRILIKGSRGIKLEVLENYLR